MPLSEVETERALLGCILAGYGLDALVDLPFERFSLSTHGSIWAAMQGCVANGKNIDHLTVAEQLSAVGKLEQVGGPAYLMGLDQAFIVPNVAEYVSMITDRYYRRQLIDKCSQVSLTASNLNISPQQAALDAAAIFTQLGTAGLQKIKTYQQAIFNVLDHLDALRRGEKIGVIPTGIDVFDEQLGGIRTKIITALGAYPGVGKSALVQRMAINMAKAGVNVGQFFLEDASEAAARRSLAYDSEIPVRRLSTDPLPDFLYERVLTAAEKEHKWAGRIFVEERRSMKASQIATVMRQMALQCGVKVVMIDHAGEIRFDAGLERHDLNISEGVRAIRDVAIELDLGLVIVQHFTRPEKKDKDPIHLRPNRSMFKNAAVFEEAARVAIGIWHSPDHPGGITATVVKQNEGDWDFDFWMPLHKPSALVESKGGFPLDPTRKGYHEG